MQINDMLISCYFNFQPCNASDFTYFYHSYYGNCYKFNGLINSTRTVNLNGEFYGLTLELYLGDPYLAVSAQSDQGILLSIQNQTSQPFWQGDVIKIDGGRATDIVLKRNLVTLLQLPYGNCSDGSGKNSYYYNYVVNTLGFNYSSEFCTKICLQANVVQNCNCTMVFFPTYGFNYSYCNFLTLRCAQSVVSRIDITSSCQQACPNECSYTQYDATTSRNNYPSYGNNSVLDNFLLSSKGVKQTFNFTKESYAKVNIFYHEMSYTTIVQTAKQQIPDIISNLGGTVGLYAGFSFLSLGEVLEILFHISFILITSIANKKRINLVNSNQSLKIDPIVASGLIERVSLGVHEKNSSSIEEITL